MNLVTPIEKMNERDLRELVDRMEMRADGAPANTRGWTRDQLVEYAESLRPGQQRRLKRERERRERMPRNRGVGKHARELLMFEACRNSDGFPVGLSYAEIVDLVRDEFPDSAFDERHARWYATKMRSEGLMIPVYRERSRWI